MDRYELRLQDYSLSEDQQMLQSALRDFFQDASPSSVVRAAEPLGFDANLWKQVLDTGFATMGAPAAAGGDDASLVDHTILAEELGRSLAPVPIIANAVAVRLLARCGTDPSVIAELGHGEIFTLALAPVAAGERQLVPEAAITGNVVALGPDGLSLYRGSPSTTALPNQGSTPVAWWSPDDADSTLLLATGAAATEAFAAATLEWRLLTASALVGLTEGALKLAVEFAKTRETFGVPIGSLQGISFPLADIAIGIGGARNLVRKATWLLEHEPDHRPDLALIAFVYAAGVARHAVETGQHTHGGLGITVEADISLYFLRAKTWPLLAGDPGRDYLDIGRAVLDSVSA
jgi:alkylation response protein AidB-like acyl-CoA dehydrogenase